MTTVRSTQTTLRGSVRDPDIFPRPHYSDEPKSTMDRPPPYQRPPDGPVNYHPQTTQAYPGYPPASQPQQQPPHAAYTVDPYSMPRRDPFLPSGPQHARGSSQGRSAGNNAPQGQAEGQGQGSWSNTGRSTSLPMSSRAHLRSAQARDKASVVYSGLVCAFL